MASLSASTVSVASLSADGGAARAGWGDEEEESEQGEEDQHERVATMGVIHGELLAGGSGID